MSTGLLTLGLLAAALSIAADPSYLVQTVAGGSFTGDGGAATKALLETVQGVAVDPLGNYFLADTDSNQIRRISPQGIISTVAGTGTPGFSGDGGPATLAQLNLPYGIATDLSSNLYVADFGNRCIRKISPNGIITTIAGLSPNTQMAGPRNIAIDNQATLYISDFVASRVYRLTAQGVFTAYAGSPLAVTLGDNGSATLAQLKNPAGLTVDRFGNLYIADTGNKRIRLVSNGIITTINATVSTPVGLSIDTANNLYVADAGAGLFLRIANPNTNQPALTAWPQPCRDVAIDHSGNVLLATANKAYRFNGENFTLIAGGNNFLFAGDGSAATGARLNHPTGLAQDLSGNLYIADSGNGRVRRVTVDGVINTYLSGFASPSGIAYDSSTGNFYVADSGAHSVLLWNSSGSILSIAAGGNGKGSSGDGGSAPAARLNTPTGVAYDRLSGTLYIADSGNNSIRVVTADGNIQTLATLPSSPASLALDPVGHLFAAEPAAGQIVTINSTGTVSSISTAGEWLNPQGLTFDSAGVLYVTDTGGERITRVDLDGTISPVAGNGVEGFSGDGGLGVLASFETPSAIVADPVTGVVYVADAGNNRIRALTPGAAATAANSTAQLVTLVNAASGLVANTVAAGELVTIVGGGADTASIQINSVPVVAASTSPGQATLDLPDDLGTSGTLEIQLLSNGAPQARVTASVVAAVPAIYPALIANSDGSMNSAMNPAARGSAITIYGTGEGRSGAPMTATLDGQLMDIASFGPSPDTPGVFGLTAYVPSGYFPAGTKQLVVYSGAFASQSGVVVNVR